MSKRGNCQLCDARQIPWTEESGRLQSMGSLRVRHDWATSLSLFTFMHWRRKWQPTPVFLPRESQDRRAWWAAVYGVTQSRTQLKWLSGSSSRKSLIANLKWTIQDKKLLEQSHLKYILIGKILVDWVHQLIKICLITIRILQKAHLPTWHNSGKKQWSWRRVNKYYPKQSTKIKENEF